MKNNKSHRTGVSIPILIGTSRTSPITDQSLQMSFHLSHPKRISKYFFQPFKKKQNKTPNTQADTKMRVKLNNDNGLQGRTTRTTGYNTVLPKWRQKCFYETFAQGGSSVLRMKFSAKTPRHRKPPNR